MRQLLFIPFILCVLLTSSYCTKKTSVSTADITKLNGTWELNFMDSLTTPFEAFYPNNKPFIMFDVGNNMVSGNTSCNSFSGKLNVTGNKIDFTQPMAMTRSFCQGEGENAFLLRLNKVKTWSLIDDHTLQFMIDEMAIMRFTKK